MNPIRKEVTIGDCRLLLGDCRKILPSIGKVNAVVTDPPFGIGFAAQPTKWQRLAGKEARDWDDKPIESLSDLLAVGDVKAVWGGNYYSLPPSRGWLSWFKPDAPPSMASLELCWTSLDRNSRQISQSIGATNAERVGHPTQKPLAVMIWTLQQIAARGTVIDPFMGPGTTLVGCAKLGLSGIGIEIDEGYFDIACERIRKAYAQPDMFIEQAKAPEPKQEAFI